MWRAFWARLSVWVSMTCSIIVRPTAVAVACACFCVSVGAGLGGGLVGWLTGTVVACEPLLDDEDDEEEGLVPVVPPCWGKNIALRIPSARITPMTMRMTLVRLTPFFGGRFSFGCGGNGGSWDIGCFSFHFVYNGLPPMQAGFSSPGGSESCVSVHPQLNVIALVARASSPCLIKYCI